MPDSRHMKLADDSIRMSVVVPKSDYKEVEELRDATRPTVSAVVRGFIAKCLYEERRESESK